MKFTYIKFNEYVCEKDLRELLPNKKFAMYDIYFIQKNDPFGFVCYSFQDLTDDELTLLALRFKSTEIEKISSIRAYVREYIKNLPDYEE